MKFLLVILLALCLTLASGRRNQKLRQRVNNLVQERPYKESKGLLEKPTSEVEDQFSDSSDETVQTAEPSWMRRVWENAFGRNSQDFFGDEVPDESSEESSESEGFLSLLRPWWKGPNVCTTESDYDVPNENSGSSQFSFLNFWMTTCRDSGRAYKCTKHTRHNSTADRVHTLTYECCLGYAREGRSRGCPKKVEQRDLMTTLNKINATKLADALEKANLTLLLKNEMVTFFAPSDDAISGGDGQNDISVVVLETADKMQFARDILRSHIVLGPRLYSSNDFEDETLLPTASNGASIRINIFHYPTPFATANCARITSSNYQTTNGYVHTIDRVLTPVKRNLWQLIEDDPRFSVIRSLAGGDVQRRLKDPKQHSTVLAFTDDTFEQLSADIRQRIQSKDECFKNLLLHHILPNTICTAALVDQRGYVRNLANRLLNATRSGKNIVSFANRKVITADQMATNGVLQVIDGVILQPEMLDIIKALEHTEGAASQLAAALTSNEISASIADAQAVTIFVPPADSISSLNTQDLRNHVVRQSVFDRFRVILNRPRTMTTEAGRNISIRFEYDYESIFDLADKNRLRLHVGCAKAEKIVSSCNGAIVFLDKPLISPTKNAYDLLKSKSELSDFVSMIDSAGLTTELKSNRFDGTILAPTNQALSRSMSTNEKTRLLANRANLRRFVKQHILLGAKCCNELSGNDWLSSSRYSTMAGTQLKATGWDVDELKVNDAEVTQCDLEATNALVHVIDGVVTNRRRQWYSEWSRDMFDE